MVLTYDIDAQNQTQQVAKSCKAPSTKLANQHVGKSVVSLTLWNKYKKTKDTFIYRIQVKLPIECK